MGYRKRAGFLMFSEVIERFGFLMFSWGIERDQWHEMGWIEQLPYKR